MSAIPRSGAQVLVDQLIIHGVDTIFCVPGESYLAVLDALYDQQQRIRLVSTRQEGGAAFMAEAYGKLTGRPGVCFVTRGPGASNASIGIHTAFHDSTPLILFVGQVARGFSEREAFQEIDYRRMFNSIAKWVTQIDDPARVPELLARAWRPICARLRRPTGCRRWPRFAPRISSITTLVSMWARWAWVETRRCAS